MPHKIEEDALRIVMKRLADNGCDVRVSDKKTFDLIVDGRYAEVKSKGKPYGEIDFISLTKKQYEALKEEDYDVYLVCNVQKPAEVEVYKFLAKDLLAMTQRVVVSYEFDRSSIDTIKKEKV